MGNEELIEKSNQNFEEFIKPGVKKKDKLEK